MIHSEIGDQASNQARPYQKGHRKWPWVLIIGLCPILFLISCAPPARYVIINDDLKDLGLEANQRYVCLMEADAQANTEILHLRTISDVRNYEQRRKERRNPVEDVLYHLIREDYQKAGELLVEYSDQIPEYLRLVLKADLTSEIKKEKVETSYLVKLYQEATEVRTCYITQEIIRLRIRQLRYGR